MSDPSQSVLIVGAGAFGLSTALFLARRAVMVLPRTSTRSSGRDMVTARCELYVKARVDVIRYEQLALKALPIWLEWTKTVHDASPADLPDGLTPEDDLLDLCGCMRLCEGEKETEYHRVNVESVTGGGRRERIFLLKDEADYKRALEEDETEPYLHRATKMQRFGQLLNGNIHGFLDMDSGYTRADKVGVKFVLDEVAGKFDSFVRSGQTVLGVKTKDGVEHLADKTIVACGGWTESIVPEVKGLLETTGGSVAFVDIPEDRPDLRKRFGPEEFCVWQLQLGEGKVGTKWALTERLEWEDSIKFGYRAVKYTNYEPHPVTGHETPLNNVPKTALEAIKDNLRQVYPELAEIGITGAKHFANSLEKKPDQFTQYWRWRSAKPGERANGLEEGEDGPRVLRKVELATEADWKFDI
ncbi:hypothetical protein IAR55_005595 [Kwoniella newhampshirensis]|uniref:FAD dependent oxidoreductase domain-containing protein n=1 Tax=Kwoniella newhampshirensis TaxID=1651941 RepID=A0AAW0YJ95_9TREE